MQNTNIKIIMADDHALVRKGIIELLKNNPLVEILAEVEDGRQLVESYFKHHPDMIISDIEMPFLSGLQAFEKIKSLDNSVKALFISIHTENIYYYNVYRSGGKGLLSKNINPEELFTAIEKIMSGGIFFGNEYTEDRLQKLAAEFNHKSNVADSVKVSLTVREIDVLACIKECLSNEEIASKLGISHRTVEKHRQNIAKKANIKNLMDLYKFAFEFTRDNI